MLILIATFLLIVGIVFGLYWWFIDRPEGQEHSALKRRLKGVRQPRKAIGDLLNTPQRYSDLGFLNRALKSMGRRAAPSQRTLAQSGLKITLGTLVLSAAVAAVLAYAVALRLTGLPLVAGACALVGLFVPFWYVRMVRNRRMLKFEEQFPEAIDLLARALRAGHALTTGLSMVAEELGDPVGPEFKTLFDQQNFGLPLPQALKAFAERIPSIDARFFVTAVLTQRESGGNLSEVLDNLAAIIRDRFRVKRQVRVISAHGRITGWVLSALPTCLGLFFAATSPEKYRTFYTDPFGIQLIVGALLLQVLGVFIIRRIVVIEY
jgi:tight adherence protein B